jgi:hypothetical protein
MQKDKDEFVNHDDKKLFEDDSCTFLASPIQKPMIKKSSKNSRLSNGILLDNFFANK